MNFQAKIYVYFHKTIFIISWILGYILWLPIKIIIVMIMAPISKEFRKKIFGHFDKFLRRNNEQTNSE